eukprot:11066981-Karenia_brevis.AAC.1
MQQLACGSCAKQVPCSFALTPRRALDISPAERQPSHEAVTSKLKLSHVTPIALRAPPVTKATGGAT